MDKTKTYSEMRREFQNLFFNKLSPWLKKYELTRIALLIIAFLICGFLTSISIFISIFALNQMSKESLECIILFLGTAYFIWAEIKKYFENTLKKKLMPNVCKCFGNLKWAQGFYENDFLISSSNLVSYTDITFDDIFKGSYKDVGYEIAEAEMEIRGRKSSRTVFKGVVVKIDMNKNFVGNTVIRPNSIFHIPISTKLRQTTLEDVIFEKKFDVYTDDEVEARYLITPAFMERLNNMKLAFNAQNVSCAFYDKYIFVGLETRKDLFSICSLVKPINDGRQFFTMFEEILSIIKLIDYFKLNEKTGL